MRISHYYLTHFPIFSPRPFTDHRHFLPLDFQIHAFSCLFYTKLTEERNRADGHKLVRSSSLATHKARACLPHTSPQVKWVLITRVMPHDPHVDCMTSSILITALQRTALSCHC